MADTKKHINDDGVIKLVSAIKSKVNDDLSEKLGKSEVAQSATSDSLNNVISDTYIKDITISGKTVTITKGNDKTTIETTQDTTYDNATSTKSGLMSSTDKEILDTLAESAVVSGSQTTTSAVDGGSNIYTFTDASGNESTFTVKNGSKGSTGATGPKGDTGATGKGISSIAVTYQGSTSNTTAPTGTWSTTIPSVAAGSYLWTKFVITYTDNNTTTAYSVAKQGSTGAAGSNASISLGTVSGTGNAITSLSLSNGVLTPAKGNTFLTAHPTISTSTDSTSSTSPSHGGSFTVIDSVTRDTNGHVTKVNRKTVKLPSDNNTDTKVNTKLGTTTKAYLLGTTTTPTSTSQAVETISDNGVYLDTTAGQLEVNSLSVLSNIYFPNNICGYASVSEAYQDIYDIIHCGDASTCSSIVISNYDSSHSWLPGMIGYNCDGSNDATIIQNAINTLSNNSIAKGGKIILLEGSYIISSNITIPQGASITIEGMGSKNTNIVFSSGKHFILNSTSTTTETTLSLKSLSLESTNQSFSNNEIFVKFSSGKNNLSLDSIFAYVQFGTSCSANYPRLFQGYSYNCSFMTVNNSKFVLTRLSTSMSYNSSVVCIAVFDNVDLKMDNSYVTTSLGANLNKGIVYYCKSNIINCTLDVSTENNNFIVMNSCDYACINNCVIKCGKLCEMTGSRGILSNNKIYCRLGGIISFDIVIGNHIQLHATMTGRSYMNIVNNVWYNNSSTAILTYSTYSVFAGNISRYKMQLDSTPTGSTASNNIYNSGVSSIPF